MNLLYIILICNVATELSNSQLWNSCNLLCYWTSISLIFSNIYVYYENVFYSYNKEECILNLKNIYCYK